MPLKPQLLVLLATTVLAMLTWSRLSELQPGTGLNHRYAGLLLALACVLRLAARPVKGRALESVSTSIDNYALATLAGLRAPRRAVPPLWLGALLLVSLPAERTLQRLAGFALQEASVLVAGAVLGLSAVLLLMPVIAAGGRARVVE